VSALQGKTALITGGSGGIGSACAKALLTDGATVVLMGRRLEALEATRTRLNAIVGSAQIEIHAGDALKAADVTAAVDKARNLRGALDVVVATVGGGGFKPILMHDADSFRAELEVNIVSAFLAVRHAAPAMTRGGSIVCVSSTAAKMTFAWLAGYCTAKGGLENFVKAAAEELGSAGIRVNPVRPGLTRNAAENRLFTAPELLARFVEQTPLKQRADGQLAEPDDIGSAVRFLAGPESAWVTGQSFAIDGGHELRKNPNLSSVVEQVYGAEALKSVRAGKAP
jgi:NAD(P)-dependent dehydrogenase (short-subunit alcohol dehydrogenase family)